MKKHYPLHAVEVDHGKNVLTTEVPKHEIKVLEVVHGKAKVRDQGELEDETIELYSNADAEFARLQRRYKRINAPDPVLLAFANGPDALEPFGFKSDGTPIADAPASAVKKHKPAKPVSDAKEADGKAAKAK